MAAEGVRKYAACGRRGAREGEAEAQMPLRAEEPQAAVVLPVGAGIY